MGASENEKLELNIAATIKFSFGTICDRVQSVLENDAGMAEKIVEFMFQNGPCTREIWVKKVRDLLREKALNDIRILQRETRNQGNSSIRIIENHMQHYKVLRRHKLDRINVERVAKNHGRRDQNGNSEVS